MCLAFKPKKNKKEMQIPEEFKINDLLNQDTYLLNGRVKSGGTNSPVFSTISSTEEYLPTILGSIPLWEKRKV
jgi:glyceraldehyde-3-phosphate dehydrogenase (NADP+)